MDPWRRRFSAAWAAQQCREAQRAGVDTRDAFLRNLTAHECYAREEWFKYLADRHCEHRGSWARKQIREAIETLRAIAFLRAWLGDPLTRWSDGTIYFHWLTERVALPLLLNAQGRAVGRLCRGQLGRGFGWQIFREPAPITGALYEMVSVSVVDTNVLAQGESKRRLSALEEFLGRLRGCKLYVGKTLDIPVLGYTGRWWHVAPKEKLE